MSEKWDGKVVMSTPGGPIVTMSLGDLLARKDAEIERQRAEIERLRAEMLHLAEWCEMEVPLTHDYMAYRLRKALEIKQ